MKQLNNGYASCYYLTREGQIYNSSTKKYLKADSKHSFRLKTEEEKYKRVTLRELYKLVYDEWYCKDTIENLENEEWKEVEDTNKLYWISSKGRIKSYAAYEAILLKPTITANGYCRVDISYQGQRQSKLVHRLVAAAFLMPPKSIEEALHHKDYNKLNNAADNLQWLNPREHAKIHQERREQEKNATVSNSTEPKNN